MNPEKFNLTIKEQKASERVCIALDVSINEAFNLAEELSDLVGFFKIGKQLHTLACNEATPIISWIYMEGNERNVDSRRPNIFLDLKLHDTPNTIYEASKACSVLGVYMFNIHISGGEEMCKKALEGAHEKSDKYGVEPPKVIGVTELTSLTDEDLRVQGITISYDDLVLKRTELAKQWGLDGIVCPANKAGFLEKEFGSDFLYVTPGIEWAGIHSTGQKQLYPPDLAVRDCSNSILVMGSAITRSENPRETTYKILKAMAQHL